VEGNLEGTLSLLALPQIVSQKKEKRRRGRGERRKGGGTDSFGGRSVFPSALYPLRCVNPLQEEGEGKGGKGKEGGACFATPKSSIDSIHRLPYLPEREKKGGGGEGGKKR